MCDRIASTLEARSGRLVEVAAGSAANVDSCRDCLASSLASVKFRAGPRQHVQILISGVGFHRGDREVL